MEPTSLFSESSRWIMILMCLVRLLRSSYGKCQMTSRLVRVLLICSPSRHVFCSSSVPPPPLQFLDLRVAVLGNVDSGKSTLLGVLTQGELDNGRGRARLNLFRHLHEIQTGRTSSISFEILGFNTKGEVRKYRRNRAELTQVQEQ